MRVVTAILLTQGLLSSGCSDSSSSTGASTTSTASAKPAAPAATTAAATATATAPQPTASATASAPSKPLGPNAIDIAPMNLALEPPAGLTGTAQPAGPDVIVRFHGREVSLTVSQAHGDLAHEKKRVAAEPGFVRWETEKDDAAIAEITVDKAKEYMGFTVKKIGDTSYECSTLTMKRPTSPSESAVKESLALCDGLRAK